MHCCGLLAPCFGLECQYGIWMGCSIVKELFDFFMVSSVGDDWAETVELSTMSTVLLTDLA